jgi:isovaleryl-CoA dehydrogenase
VNAVPSTPTQTPASAPLDRLDSVIAEVVEPAAAEVDRTGTFPRAAIDALAAAGILGAASSTDVGGAGLALADQAEIVQRLAGSCASTAMIVLMHFAATSVVEVHGPLDVRRAIAAGEHLTTLAFSEQGSRSHFWAPMSTATPEGDEVRLDARKSWITSAGEADSYVWSSRPLLTDGPMTLWLVASDADGLGEPGRFDGLGLRGNGSSPVAADGVMVSRTAMLGDDGAGLDIALSAALPVLFLVGNAAFSVGLARALVDEAAAHLRRTRLEHLGITMAEQPAARADFAALLIRTDEAHAFLADTLAALAGGREDATLRVLEVKAVAGEAAADVADGVMRLCGGSAFRKELGVERRFRDALAARVMAPTTAALREFVGRAALGQPLLDAAGAS